MVTTVTPRRACTLENEKYQRSPFPVSTHKHPLTEKGELYHKTQHRVHITQHSVKTTGNTTTTTTSTLQHHTCSYHDPAIENTEDPRFPGGPHSPCGHVPPTPTAPRRNAGCAQEGHCRVFPRCRRRPHHRPKPAQPEYRRFRRHLHPDRGHAGAQAWARNSTAGWAAAAVEGEAGAGWGILRSSRHFEVSHWTWFLC